MATSNRVFVSPGVYTSEFELSFIAQSVGVTTLGIAGETLKGPAFEPIFIKNYEEFINYFGDTSPEKFVNTQIPKYEAAYIAKAYLQQSNQLFVTRILGLSGYDAGPSWSITTVGGLNTSSINWVTNSVGGTAPPSTSTDFTVPSVTFTAYTSSTYTTVILGSTLSGIPINFNSVLTYNNTTYTITESMQLFIQNAVNSIYGSSTPATSHAVFYGPAVFLPASYPNSVIYLSGQTMNAATVDLTSPLNQPWYNSLFTYSSGSYSGVSFMGSIGSVTTTATPNEITGVMSFSYFQLSGATAAGWDDIVVATIRSRGVSDYTITDGGPVYEVNTLANLTMFCNNLSSNPYEPFVINGTATTAGAFSLDVSMLPTDSKYLPRVLGVSNFDKNKDEVPVFVEEIYPNLIEYGINYGYIQGFNCSFIDLLGARGQFASTGNNPGPSIGWYLDKYQTPESPWLVSQLQGNKVTRLFKFISISDGNAANTEIKLSILNISYTNNTFDIAVRDFNDTDANPIVLEKFTNCNMDPDSPGYVGKKVGTANGEYGLNSRFIMLEINYTADKLLLPCGFEGYVVRNYDTATPPFPIYKTKYNYPGEPLYGSVISLGDKVRRTYLGFSDGALAGRPGIDGDLLQYKGKKYEALCVTNPSSWDYQTKGFHLDSGATVCLIGPDFSTSGQTAFEVGPGDITTEPTSQTNPYYFTYARKFTLVMQGGFDGWNVYDEHRTNNDEFQIGRPYYLNSACPSPRFPTSAGSSFKQVTIDANTVDWSSSDYYAYLLGIRTFNNPAAVNINVLATPGIDYLNHWALCTNTIDMIENDRADSIYIMTSPDWEMYTANSTDFANFINPDDIVTILEDTEIDSNYTATYYPWVLIRDSVNNTQIYLPPTGEVCRNLALTDNIAFPWFATAGYTRGIVNSVKARKKLTQDDRDELYTGRINPIATFADVGTVIWGNKTLQITEGALNRVNVRRLLLQARKLISAVAIRLLFEQNDQKVRQDFLSAVNPILDAIRRDRGLYDFRVTVSNDPEDFDKQQLVGKIYIKPTKALEFIDIQFYITPQGASFENI